MTDLQDGKPLSQHRSKGDSSLAADQTVAKVDDLHVPQVPQSLQGQRQERLGSNTIVNTRFVV